VRGGYTHTHTRTHIYIYIGGDARAALQDAAVVESGQVAAGALGAAQEGVRRLKTEKGSVYG